MGCEAQSVDGKLVTYLGSGGKVGDTIKAEVTCDKCE
jgi:hypothetical protein